MHSRIRLGPIRDLINGKGMVVRWMRTTKCPCVDGYGARKFDCPVCHGRGYMVHATLLTNALVSGMQQREPQNLVGLVDAGQMTLTLLPQFPPVVDGDRFVLCWWTRRASDIITRRPEARDPLLQFEPTAILVVTGLVPSADSEAVHVYDPAGYSLDLATGSIVWDPLATDVPAIGDRYTVNYDFKPVYQVARDDQPGYRQSDGQKLPQRVTIRYVMPTEGPDHREIEIP
jgi:hypothetical protein